MGEQRHHQIFASIRYQANGADNATDAVADAKGQGACHVRSYRLSMADAPGPAAPGIVLDDARTGSAAPGEMARSAGPAFVDVGSGLHLLPRPPCYRACSVPRATILSDLIVEVSVGELTAALGFNVR